MLACARFENGFVFFIIHELVDAVSTSEPLHCSCAMLHHAPGEIVRNADVKRAVAPAGEDIDKEAIGHFRVPRARWGAQCRSADPGSILSTNLDPGSAAHRFATLRAAVHPGNALGPRVCSAPLRFATCCAAPGERLSHP